MMFGPSDKESLHTADTMKWKIKRFSNDDLRQKFIDATVPQGHYLGLTFPDPELKLDEKTGHWRFGEIDWSEFKRVLAGDGPCNRQRMQRAHAGRTRMAPGCARRRWRTPGSAPSARRRPGSQRSRDMIVTACRHASGPAQRRPHPLSHRRSAHGRVHGRAGRRQRAGRAQPGLRVAPARTMPATTPPTSWSATTRTSSST